MRRSFLAALWLGSAVVGAAHAGAARAGAAPRGDASQPIEISADKLEVLQPSKQAVFTGNVEAVQGQTHLKADRMTVYYRTGEDADKANPQGTVSKIDVDGHVRIETPTETGQGDHGTYLVDTKLVTLIGNVTLRRDKNLLKGEKLEYSLETGRSVLSAAKGGATTQGGGGRVKGVFLPQKSGK